MDILLPVYQGLLIFSSSHNVNYSQNDATMNLVWVALFKCSDYSFLHTCCIYLLHRSVDFLSMQFSELLHFCQIWWILSKKSEVIINAGSLCCLRFLRFYKRSMLIEIVKFQSGMIIAELQSVETKSKLWYLDESAKNGHSVLTYSLMKANEMLAFINYLH